jgi:hypothetical protein
LGFYVPIREVALSVFHRQTAKSREEDKYTAKRVRTPVKRTSFAEEDEFFEGVLQRRFQITMRCSARSGSTDRVCKRIIKERLSQSFVVAV